MRGPFWASGIVAYEGGPVESACFGDECPPGTMHFVDLALKPQHGDKVMIWHLDQDGSGTVHSVTKRYYIIDGEPFASCNWYTLPVSWIPNLKIIAPIVREEYLGYCPPHVKHQVWTGDQAAEQAWRDNLNNHPVNRRAIKRLAEIVGDKAA